MVDKTVKGGNSKAATHLKKAQHALKTGVFKWSKDYDEAATQYELAAKSFRDSGHEDEAANCFLEFARCSEH